MAKAPTGDMLDPAADAFFVDAPNGYEAPVGDSEDARIARMYAAAIGAHFVAVMNPSAADEFERAESRRILTSMIPEFAATRSFLCDSAGFDPDEIRARAIAMIADADKRARCVTALRNLNMSREHPGYRRVDTALAAE